ncbi:hypothetical protein B0I37DRAFT_407111 [Chaetomium sp. MPI-CAGE-AT-0009]|nr:hypothetical protein B0I37DRAFT_407111 [Chaetomium sp. MPI-CAGE-AT-0009]
MASPGPLQKIFDDAKAEFQSKLPAGTRFQDLLSVATIDELYDATDKLQRSHPTRLHNMQRIQPFLARIQAFAGVAEVFVQGPIKLFLTWTIEWQQGFEAIVRTMERIGDLLPLFTNVLSDFVDKKHIQDILGLFYRDILDFHWQILQFFALPRRKIMFETLWPKRRERIAVVEANIERHARLLGENITFESIKREHEARLRAFAEYQEAETFRANQKFHALKTALCPRMYDDKLEWLSSRTYPGTAGWLAREEAFREWMDVSSSSKTLLWLQGIPGAGKSFLACWVVKRLNEQRYTALYAFLSHVHTNTTAISVIHTLLFQLASRDENLQAMLTNSNTRDFMSNLVAAKSLLEDVLKCKGPTFVVIDGLDEIEEVERKLLQSSLLDVLHACKDTGLRVCISSRAEDDIARLLVQKAAVIRINDRNRGGIYTYVNSRFDEWMRNADFLQEGESEIRALLFPICMKARGMFLYARIVLDNVDLINIEDVRKELRAPPEDLNHAYERVFSRINRLSTRKQDRAKRILGWIGSSPVPLTIHELEQAICSVSGCDFTVIGYQTANGLEQHRRKVHLVIRETDYTQPSTLDDEALHTLLYEQIESEAIDELETIWPTCSQKMTDFTKAELIMQAADQGSLPMVQLFLEWDEQEQEPRNTAVKFGGVINHAIQSGNLELSRWILDRATAWGRQRPGRYRDAVVAVLKSDSAEIFEVWEDTISSVAPESAHIAQELFEKTVLNTAKRFPDQELRMFETWGRLVGTGKVQPSDLGRGLTNVAQTTCSIEQAKLLLNLGAPIDYPSLESPGDIRHCTGQARSPRRTRRTS